MSSYMGVPIPGPEKTKIKSSGAMTKLEAVQAGEEAAEKASVVGWFVGGLAIAIVTIPLAYISKPEAPELLRAAHDDDETESYFARGYAKALRARQVKAAWFGFVVAIVVWWFGFGLSDL